MKKLIYLVLILSIFLYCAPKQEKIERIIEDGVEVVVNHLEPYQIKGEPTTLILEEEFVIDTERDEIAEIGLTDIYGFDVDSGGNIYLFKPPWRKDNLICKFNRSGEFIISFGRKGQGPGEVQRPSYQRITNKDEIPIVDVHACKFLLFDSNGDLINEVYIDSNIAAIGQVFPLENGDYLARRLKEELRKIGEPTGKYTNLILSIFNSEFEEIKEVDRLKLNQAIRNPY